MRILQIFLTFILNFVDKFQFLEACINSFTISRYFICIGFLMFQNIYEIFLRILEWFWIFSLFKVRYLDLSRFFLEPEVFSPFWPAFFLLLGRAQLKQAPARFMPTLLHPVFISCPCKVFFFSHRSRALAYASVAIVFKHSRRAAPGEADSTWGIYRREDRSLGIHIHFLFSSAHICRCLLAEPPWLLTAAGCVALCYAPRPDDMSPRRATGRTLPAPLFRSVHDFVLVEHLLIDLMRMQ